MLTHLPPGCRRGKPLARLLLARAVVLIAAGLWIGSSFSVEAAASLRERLDERIKPYLESEILIGLSVGILVGEDELIAGFGRLGRAGTERPDGDTLYEIGSITKVMTGILLAEAVARKEVALEQPIDSLLPESAHVRSGQPPIQLVHLATHTSGLPRLPDNMRPADPANPYADYSADHLHAFLMDWSPATPPGNKSEYSNLGAGLLGHLLARQAGTTYEALLKERILAPLRMDDTAICLTSEMHERLARPHHADGSPAATWDIPVLAGAGAVRSSVRDMLKFLKAQLHGPEGTLGQGIETAWKIHWKPRSTHDVALGLGWHIARDGHTRWHNGRTGGYGAMALVSRKEQIAVVVLANTATDEVDRLAEEIFQVAAGKDPPLRLFPKTPALAVPVEILHRYAGRYALSPEFHLTVRVEGDQLLVQATGQPAFRVFPASETEWFYKVVDARLTFQRDGEGRCETLTLHQNGRDMPGHRVGVPVKTPGSQP